MTTLCIVNNGQDAKFTNSYSQYDWLFRTNGSFLILNDIINANEDFLTDVANIPFTLREETEKSLMYYIDTLSPTTLRSYIEACNLKHYSEKQDIVKYYNTLHHVIFLPVGCIPVYDMQKFLKDFLNNMKLQFRENIQLLYFSNTHLLSQFISINGNVPTVPTLLKYIKQQLNITDIIKEQIYLSSVPSLIVHDLNFSETERQARTIYSFLKQPYTNVQLPEQLIPVESDCFKQLQEQLCNTTLKMYVR